MERGIEDIAWGKFLWIQVEIDTGRPLRRVRKMNVDGKKCWLGLKYERLPKFCYFCGRLGHGEKDCELRLSTGLQMCVNPQYGDWLRAREGTERRDASKSSDRNAVSDKGGSNRPPQTGPGSSSLVEANWAKKVVDVITAEAIDHNEYSKWNYWGLENLRVVRELRELIRSESSFLVFIVETKCGRIRMDEIKDSRVMYGVFVPAKGKFGGLALWWKKTISVSLVGYNERFIDVEEVVVIKQIPLGRQGNPDKLVWHYTKNGQFSVKSSCHLIMDTEDLLKTVVEGSSGENNRWAKGGGEVRLLLWVLWSHRNRVIFEKRWGKLEYIVSWAEGILEDFSGANENGKVGVPRRVMFLDGSNQKRSFSSPMLGELWATKERVVAAIKRGYDRVISEGDATEVIKALQGVEEDLSEFEVVVEDIKKDLMQLGHVEFSWMARKNNIMAHRLAKYAIEHKRIQVWSEEIPSFLDEDV
ncbi:hypothetical protein ACH5RR_037481 [Cinchona calisaya]|uniref:CCHC-type domain-containing protein n=1 Tax=Cinchona calisaya TaxID=153742 RepID=A0ABD2Y9E8_9GENT